MHCQIQDFKGGSQPGCDFIKFSQKLHEAEKNLVTWGGGGEGLSGAPRSTTAM